MGKSQDLKQSLSAELWDHQLELAVALGFLESFNLPLLHGTLVRRQHCHPALVLRQTVLFLEAFGGYMSQDLPVHLSLEL
jgi:hypothetical protein